MRARIPQPPIQPGLRDAERHEFWVGFIVSVLALLLLLVGATHLTGVDTTEGNSARETQLIKAFSSGGLQQVDRNPPPRPPDPNDPSSFAAHEEQSQRALAAKGPRWKVLVNLGASTPCPT
jgi:hypothetical protein